MKSEKMRQEDGLREILELREQGKKHTSEIRYHFDSRGEAELLAELVKGAYVMLRGNQLSFTKEGEKKAQEILRHKRLLKKFFSDILKVDSGQEMICEFEHYLSEEVADKLCTFLGHPKEEHGKEIPQGKCCAKPAPEEEGLVTLEALKVGQSGEIAAIETEEHARLQRFAAMGLSPGTIIRLRQKSPFFIVEIENNEVALSEELAAELVIRKA